MRVEHEGLDTYIYTGGEPHQPDHPSIVFIHGAGMNHTVWTLMARYWAKASFNVVSVDLPGHGLTAGEPCVSIEQNAEFVCGLLNRLGLDGVVNIVGHSMGSLVALECATRLDNVQCLAMLGTTVPMAVGEPLLNAARDNDQSAVDMISLFGHSYGSQIGKNPVAGISAQLLAERILESSADGVLYAALNACNEYKNGFDAAGAVMCPVGLILGEQDQMTPAKTTSKLLQTFANVTELRIPDCGHMMMSEKPEATHQALRSVIEGSA